MESIPFQIWDAACRQDVEKWTHCWKSWPHREVFAHPNYTKLFVDGTSRALCAVLSVEGVTVLYPFIFRNLVAEPFWRPELPLAADVITPYGYGGPFVWGGQITREITASFWNAFDQWARDHNVVSEFIRFALFSDELLDYPGKVCDRYPNVVRELDLEDDELWMDFKHKVRKNIKKARRSGVQIELDPAGKKLDSFLRVYAGTMCRRSALEEYYFQRQFFESIHDGLDGQFLYFHAVYKNQIVSTELVLVSADTVYSFLGGTDHGAFDVRPNDLLKFEIIQWARRNDKKRFVLGGGAQPEDGIYQYKLAFAPSGRVLFRTGERVLREDLYAALVENRRNAAHSVDQDWNPQPEFFPRYRAQGDVRVEDDQDAGSPQQPAPVQRKPLVPAIQRSEPEPQPVRQVFLSPPHMSPRERELLLDAFDSNWIAPLGPHVDEFEREFANKIGTAHAVALSSGTAALHLSMLLAGVGQGDEVLTSSLTFAATANAITYVGAQPVFIDSDRESWNMDPELLGEELEANAKRGKLPKAVVAVDLYGQCADYDRIVKICQFYDVLLIEDAAEALGATYNGASAGTFGTLGVFSFNGNKIITTSGGGMLVTDRKDWAEKARFLATQARDPVPHYQHSEIGYNYGMSNLLAAVGRGQLSVLDTRVDQRRANFDYYRQALADLPGISFMAEISGGRSTRWLTCITVDPDRFGATADDIRLAHERQSIESRPLWKPMHLQPVFADCRIRGGAVAENLFNQGLCLPSGSNLSDNDRERVVDAVRSVCKRPTVVTRIEGESSMPSTS